MRETVTLDNGGGSWNQLAAGAGIDPPMLAPGDRPMCLLVNAALYWPVVPAELQEARPASSPTQGEEG